MHAAPESLSAAMVREALQFTRCSFEASASVFFWIDPGRKITGVETVGIAPEIMDHYLAGMNRFDPLNIYELLDTRKSVAILEQERSYHPTDNNRIYAEFLAKYGAFDELDFIFRQDGVPFATLALLKCHGDRPFGDRMLDLNATQKYLEFNLKMHERMRRTRLAELLAGRFGLTPREIEVVEMLNTGAQNLVIAQSLGIGLATVKTHVINILNKLGVESRAAIVAFTGRLQLS